MELAELKSIWQAHDAKLDKNLKLNEHSVELIQTQNLKSKVKPLFWYRLTEVILHTTVILFLLAFLGRNISQITYSVSAFALLVFYCFALLSSARQLITLNKIDYSDDIVQLQTSLTILQTNIINYAKLSVLFIPTFLAYPVVIPKALNDWGIATNFNINANSNGSWWLTQTIAAVLLIPIGIWFHNQVSHKNIHKKWVKNFIRRTSGTRVVRSLELMEELRTLKQNNS